MILGCLQLSVCGLVLLISEAYILNEESKELFDYYETAPIAFNEKDYMNILDANYNFEFWTFAFNRTFHAYVSPSENLRTPRNATVTYQSGEEIPFNDKRHYSVYVEGKIGGDNESLVQGNLKIEKGQAKEFIGVIRTGINIFVLEPSHRLFSQSEPSSVVIYKDWDVIRPECRDKTSLACGDLIFDEEGLKSEEDIEKHKESRQTSLRLPKESRRTNITEYRGKSCPIEVVCDEFAFKHYYGNNHEMIAEILLLFKLADQIYRLTDFDGDGEPDNIGFMIEKFTIYQNNTNVFTDPRQDPTTNYTMRSLESRVFFYECAKRASKFCLSVCISSRDWGGNQGLVAIPELEGAQKMPRYSGLCALPQPGIMINMNVATLNLRLSGNRNMALMQVAYTLAHEIGHSFGARHDPELPDCIPRGHEGNYLMTNFLEEFTRGPKIRLFSPCSIRSIKNALELQGSCLKAQDLVRCGNAIVEPNEQCDCGPVGLCDLIDPCCWPEGGSQESPGCTFREGAQCSYRANQPCCTRRCKIRPAGDFCYPGVGGGHRDHSFASSLQASLECRALGACDGKVGSCPSSSKPMPDGTPCGPHYQHTCSRGQCNSTICTDYGLPECECSDSEKRCELCCIVENGACAPASKIFNIGRILKGLGHACGNYLGYCDGKGICISRGIKRGSKGTSPSWRTWMEKSWSYLLNLLLLLVLILLILLILAARKKKKREEKEMQQNLYTKKDNLQEVIG